MSFKWQHILWSNIFTLQGLSISPSGIAKSHGMLLYHIATKVKPQISVHIPLLSQYVVEGKIESELRLNGR